MAGTTTSNNFTEDEDVYHASAPGSRRRGREIALQGLYAIELSGEPAVKVLRDVLGFHEEESVIRDFARDVVIKAVEHHDELDGLIRRHVTNWDFDRIAIIDRIVLRMAICEFLYFFDIPPRSRSMKPSRCPSSTAPTRAAASSMESSMPCCST